MSEYSFYLLVEVSQYTMVQGFTLISKLQFFLQLSRTIFMWEEAKLGRRRFYPHFSYFSHHFFVMFKWPFLLLLGDYLIQLFFYPVIKILKTSTNTLQKVFLLLSPHYKVFLFRNCCQQSSCFLYYLNIILFTVFPLFVFNFLDSVPPFNLCIHLTCHVFTTSCCKFVMVIGADVLSVEFLFVILLLFCISLFFDCESDYFIIN